MAPKKGPDEARFSMHAMLDAAGRQEGAQAADGDATIREPFGPALRRKTSREIGIRRWSALGSLAAGLGLMAGGLEPVGLSLSLVGAAVLLGEMERSGLQRASRAARTNAAAP